MKTLAINSSRIEKTQFEVLSRDEMKKVKGGGHGTIIIEKN